MWLKNSVDVVVSSLMTVLTFRSVISESSSRALRIWGWAKEGEGQKREVEGVILGKLNQSCDFLQTKLRKKGGSSCLLSECY